MAEANGFLKNRGVWLIFGDLSGIEGSGLMDRGTQYAVIDDRYTDITGTL